MTDHDRKLFELGDREFIVYTAKHEDEDGVLFYSPFAEFLSPPFLTCADVIELTAALLAWLCNDVVDDAAITRGRLVVVAMANSRTMQMHHPVAFKSALAEMQQIADRYPDLVDPLHEELRAIERNRAELRDHANDGYEPPSDRSDR